MIDQVKRQVTEQDLDAHEALVNRFVAARPLRVSFAPYDQSRFRARLKLRDGRTVAVVACRVRYTPKRRYSTVRFELEKAQYLLAQAEKKNWHHVIVLYQWTDTVGWVDLTQHRDGVDGGWKRTQQVNRGRHELSDEVLEIPLSVIRPFKKGNAYALPRR